MYCYGPDIDLWRSIDVQFNWDVPKTFNSKWAGPEKSKLWVLVNSEHERAILDVKILKFNSKYGYSIWDCCNKSGSLLQVIIRVRSTQKISRETTSHLNVWWFDLTDILIKYTHYVLYFIEIYRILVVYLFINTSIKFIIYIK